MLTGSGAKLDELAVSAPTRGWMSCRWVTHIDAVFQLPHVRVSLLKAITSGLWIPGLSMQIYPVKLNSPGPSFFWKTNHLRGSAPPIRLRNPVCFQTLKQTSYNPVPPLISEKRLHSPLWRRFSFRNRPKRVRTEVLGGETSAPFTLSSGGQPHQTKGLA